MSANEKTAKIKFEIEFNKMVAIISSIVWYCIVVELKSLVETISLIYIPVRV